MAFSPPLSRIAAPFTQIAPNGWNLNGIFFDAWLRLSHESTLEITHHPVETGAPITDHAFMNPLQFSFDIAMSDVNNSPLPVQSLGAGRSVETYRTLLNLQASRQFCTLTSKYFNYRNILIRSITVNDDAETQNACFATINLERVIVVSTLITTAVSSIPQSTDVTPRGSLNVQPLPVNSTGGFHLLSQDFINYFNPVKIPSFLNP